MDISASAQQVKAPKPIVKPVAERLKEGVSILGKLKGLGIVETEPGYRIMKERIDAWVKNDEAWAGKADFVRYGRRAYVNLPIKPDCEATAVLKVWKF
jgi:hypothetical protein